MAVISTDQTRDICCKVNKESGDYERLKSAQQAALQAVEDFWEANLAKIGADMDAATSPIVFPEAVKGSLVKFWMEHKVRRSG